MNFAIIPAGGKGQRFRDMMPKQLIPLRGKPLLCWTLKPFHLEPQIHRIILVYPFDASELDYRRILEQENMSKVRLVKGGEMRFHSVRNGFRSIQDAAPDDNILIHDAARPLVSAGLIRRLLAEASEKGAVIPVLPVQETIKEVDQGSVLRTLSRERVCVSQTPQAFRNDVLRQAYDHVNGDVTPMTDESMLVEHAGIRVFTIPGEKQNVKVTTTEDLPLVEYYLGKGSL
jgi:2-C-methyl-D-erythritol 4-phosphate cytidylyltransferase